MSLTYIFLVFTVISCFIGRLKSLTIGFISISILMALLHGIIDSYGLFSIIGFYTITNVYFQNHHLNNIAKFLLLTAILFITACFAFHWIPGFYNTLILDMIAISPISIPFSMYLNFDKTIAGMILFINSNLYKDEKPLNVESLIITFKLLFLCSTFLIISGLLSGYIKFDFKIPDILLIWCINNLFFVCLAEEVIFRGIIQNKLNQLLSTKHLPLILASLIFGATHFKGGILYILFVSISGAFYGFAYEKTRRILCAMMVHFGLNLTHLVFFTYPAPAAIKIIG